MATGINEEKVNTFKVELLDYVETLNSILVRLDNCKATVQANLEGAGKREIIDKFDAIIAQMPKVSANIKIYINLLDKVVRNYELQDSELSSDVTKMSNFVEEGL